MLRTCLSKRLQDVVVLLDDDGEEQHAQVAKLNIVPPPEYHKPGDRAKFRGHFDLDQFLIQFRYIDASCHEIEISRLSVERYVKGVRQKFLKNATMNDVHGFRDNVLRWVEIVEVNERAWLCVSQPTGRKLTGNDETEYVEK